MAVSNLLHVILLIIRPRQRHKIAKKCGSMWLWPIISDRNIHSALYATFLKSETFSWDARTQNPGSWDLGPVTLRIELVTHRFLVS